MSRSAHGTIDSRRVGNPPLLLVLLDFSSQAATVVVECFLLHHCTSLGARRVGTSAGCGGSFCVVDEERGGEKDRKQIPRHDGWRGEDAGVP